MPTARRLVASDSEPTALVMSAFVSRFAHLRGGSKQLRGGKKGWDEREGGKAS